MEYSEASNDYVDEYRSVFTPLEAELLEIEHFFSEPKFPDVFNVSGTLGEATDGLQVVDSIINPDFCEDYLLDFVNDETNMKNEMTEEEDMDRIFRFKRKPRGGRKVKRGRPASASYEYLKSYWRCRDDESLECRSFDDVYDDVINGGSKIQKGKIGRRRKKRHRSWSVPEVLKLVEGVSQYGVGRWTEIKRLFFSSCPHRSSVDLKDKWRNLLRASYKLPCVKQRGEWVQGNGSPTIPHHILCRVRELSITHPYPRKRERKIKV